MEVVIFIALIVFLIILIKLNSFTRNHFNQQDYRLKNLQNSLDKIQTQLKGKEIKTEDVIKEVINDIPLEKEEEFVEEPLIEEVNVEDSVVEGVIADRQESIPYLLSEEPVETPEKEDSYQYSSEYEFKKDVASVDAKPRKSFFERYPDLEKFIFLASIKICLINRSNC